MPTTHVEVLSRRYKGADFVLDVSVHESQMLPGAFLVRLTHTGDYRNDFHDVRVLFESSTTPGGPFTHAQGVSLNPLPSSQFEVRANHIARAMTVEVRLFAPHGSSFQVTGAWHWAVTLDSSE